MTILEYNNLKTTFYTLKEMHKVISDELEETRKYLESDAAMSDTLFHMLREQEEESKIILSGLLVSIRTVQKAIEGFEEPDYVV